MNTTFDALRDHLVAYTETKLEERNPRQAWSARNERAQEIVMDSITALLQQRIDLHPDFD